MNNIIILYVYSGWNPTYPGTKYDGKFLHNIASELLKDTRLSDTLTNVVIPTFDIKKFHPVTFSSFKVLSMYIYTIIFFFN